MKKIRSHWTTGKKDGRMKLSTLIRNLKLFYKDQGDIEVYFIDVRNKDYYMGQIEFKIDDEDLIIMGDWG